MPITPPSACSRPILVIEHPDGGTAGVFDEVAQRAAVEMVSWCPADVTSPPVQPAGAAGILVLGGAMNVGEADALHYLGHEIALLRDCLATDVPVLGVCLGSQLVAAAAGAEVRRMASPEIGWHPVEPLPAAAADAVFARLAAEPFSAYQWHSHAFDLPAGAVALARTAACLQAYRIGRAWGVQFHPEVTDGILNEWIADWDSDPDAVAMGFDPEIARGELAERLPAWNEIGRTLFDAFLRSAGARPSAVA
jgi:GMP synthase-like glutamine amidotransferase